MRLPWPPTGHWVCRSTGTPAAADINQHFKDEGSASANNALGKLVKEKKLKRVPLGKGIRGSRYSLT